MSKTRVWSVCIGFAAAAGAAPADVLYDSLPGLSYWHTFGDQTMASIGGETVFGSPIDSQVADDFTIAGAHAITRVTADFTSILGTVAPGGGPVLVEFFANAGGTPSEAAAASVMSAAWTTENFYTVGFTDPIGARLSIDVSAAGISLDAGTWWVSVTPVDVASSGDVFIWLGLEDTSTGHAAHFRDGGLDHGNGYGGFYGYSDWSTAWLPDGLTTMSLRIEGTPVPAPAAATVLTASGLLAPRRRRA